MNMTTQDEILKLIIENDKLSPLNFIPVPVLQAFAEALSQPNEPVARVIHQFETPEGTREILCVRLVDRLDVHTKLYASTPNTSELEQANKLLEAKCKELGEFKNSVIDQFIVAHHTYDESINTYDNLSKLIAYHQEIALDPKVSKVADEWVTKIADLTAKLEKMREALSDLKRLNDYEDNYDSVIALIDKTLEECE